jgi:hypothetical protein
MAMQTSLHSIDVAEEPGQEVISFWGQKVRLQNRHAGEIPARLKLKKINFTKMDIEGL